MPGEDMHPKLFCDIGKPALSDAQATRLVETVFGLQVSEIQPLPSYIDQNFHIKTTDVEKTTNKSNFVLRITNCRDSQNMDCIEVQTCVTMFLKDEGFPTATIVPTQDGKIMSLQSIDYGTEKKEHMVRLLTYLPGCPLAELTVGPDILTEVGKTAAKLDKALERFAHPKIQSLDRRHFIWNLENSPLLEELVYVLDQERPRRVVEQTILEFKRSIFPILGDFRPCINHGDLNDLNILLQETRRDPFGKVQDLYEISGILDFNNMIHGYYVFEVAIAMMAMMCESKDPLKAAGYVLAGFESIIPLTPLERDSLYVLVKCRYSQSLVIAKYSSLQQPENEDYLMSPAKKRWNQLFTMVDCGKEATEKIWFDSAKAYNESTQM